MWISKTIGSFLLALGHTLSIVGEILVEEKENPDGLTILEDGTIGDNHDKQ